MMPPTAGETAISTGPTAAVILAASALHSRSVRSACMKTRFFCRNTGLCRPEDNTKCPSRRAPAARNSARTSSVFMSGNPATVQRIGLTARGGAAQGQSPPGPTAALSLRQGRLKWRGQWLEEEDDDG